MFATVRCIYKMLSTIKFHRSTKVSKVMPEIVSNNNSNQVVEQMNKTTFDNSVNLAKRVETYDSTSKTNMSKMTNHYYQNTDHIKRYIE